MKASVESCSHKYPEEGGGGGGAEGRGRKMLAAHTATASNLARSQNFTRDVQAGIGHPRWDRGRGIGGFLKGSERP